MKVVKLFAVMALVLGMAQSAFAVQADWAEEMILHPQSPMNDKLWAPKENNPSGGGTWISTLSVLPSSGGATGVWQNNVNRGNIGSPINPTVDSQKYTIEYRVRHLQPLPTGLGGPVKPVWMHNSGSGSQTGASQISRARNWLSYHAGGADLWFESPGAGANRYQYANTDLGGTAAASYWNQPGILGQWHTVRTIFDNTVATPYMSIYIDGAHIATVNHSTANASMMAGVDDPGFFFGAQPEPGNGSAESVAVQWDYIRMVSNMAVPITEAITPEPSTLSLLGLAGLALLHRRRR